jgi:hypothetical protein
MTTESNNAQDHKTRWQYLVGKFILAFGEIELITFYLWKKYFEQKDPPGNFSERTKKILHHVKNDPAATNIVANLLIESLEIAKRRNIVAHHPISVQAYRHSATGSFLTKRVIISITTNDYITDEELEKLGQRATEIVSSLQGVLWLGPAYTD